MTLLVERPLCCYPSQLRASCTCKLTYYQPRPPPPPIEQVHRPNLMGFFPVILKLLYDCDIVEEESMLMWAGEQGRSEEFTPAALNDEQVAALRAKATPFVTWLEEADEEDEDDDDDDEEV